MLPIPADRDVIIISHPRSGSNWFQSCLPHVNCFEPFSFDLVDTIPTNNIVYTTNFATMSYSQRCAVNNQKLSKLDKIDSPKSVKIQYLQLCCPYIIRWIQKQKATLIWLERKNKLAAFKSLCVARASNQWTGGYECNELTVNLADVIPAYNAIYKLNKNKIERLFGEMIYTTYEDLLLTETLISVNPPVVMQNSSNIKILNWVDVQLTLAANGLTL